jgi:CHASE3 domain sensor protein
MKRMDLADAAARKADEDTKKAFDAEVNQMAKDILGDRQKNTRDKISSLTNPFQNAGVNGFGSASAGGPASQEGNRLMAQMLKALQAMEANTDYLTRGLN